MVLLLFFDDFNSSTFLYSNIFLIVLIPYEKVVHSICTVIKLGHSIIYENHEAVNTTKQSFQTAWP